MIFYVFDYCHGIDVVICNNIFQSCYEDEFIDSTIPPKVADKEKNKLHTINGFY